jgi:hypothetical protein
MTMSPATANDQYWPCGGVLVHGMVAISPCGADLRCVKRTLKTDPRENNCVQVQCLEVRS